MSESSKIRRWTADGQEWACIASDHGPLCRLCKPVDEMLAVMLTHVENGVMDVIAGPDGEFRFGLTATGRAMAADLITTMAMEEQFDPTEGQEDQHGA